VFSSPKELWPPKLSPKLSLPISSSPLQLETPSSFRVSFHPLHLLVWVFLLAEGKKESLCVCVVAGCPGLPSCRARRPDPSSSRPDPHEQTPRSRQICRRSPPARQRSPPVAALAVTAPVAPRSRTATGPAPTRPSPARRHARSRAAADARHPRAFAPCRLPSRSPARPDVRPRARPCRAARRVRIARQRPCARAVPLACRVPSVRAHSRAPAPSPAVPACQQLQVRVAVPRECPELSLLFYCFFRRFRC